MSPAWLKFTADMIFRFPLVMSFRAGESLHQSVLSKSKISENFQKCPDAGVSR